MEENIQIPECLRNKSFRSEYEKVLTNIIYTSAWIHEHFKTRVCTGDITPQQFNILKILNNSDRPLSVLQIRSQLLDKMSDTSRIVDRLMSKKLVEKKVCCHDKRLVDISITTEGEEILEAIERRACELDKKLSVLSLEEVQQLNYLLNKIRVEQ